MLSSPVLVTGPSGAILATPTITPGIIAQINITRADVEAVRGDFTYDVKEAILLDYVVKGHVREVRKHLLCLGPTLLYIRERKLYALHPEGFDTFEEWLGQSGIGLSLPQATDFINWSVYAAPILEGFGIDANAVADSLDVSKLRLLVPEFRRSAEGKSPLDAEQVRSLVDMAAGSTWKQLKNHLHPPGTHDEDEPDPIINFRVERRNEKYRIYGVFTAEEMLFIQGRLRSTWLGPNGEILRLSL